MDKKINILELFFLKQVQNFYLKTVSYMRKTIYRVLTNKYDKLYKNFKDLVYLFMYKYKLKLIKKAKK